jgi:hypothetical protein
MRLFVLCLCVCLASALEYSYQSRLESMIGREMNGKLIKEEDVPKFRFLLREEDASAKMWSFTCQFTNGDFRLFREGTFRAILPGLLSPVTVRLCTNYDPVLCQNQPADELSQTSSPFLWDSLRASPAQTTIPLVTINPSSSVIKSIDLVPV